MIFTFVSHIQPFLWEPRGFSSIEEMNEAIVERWNKIVKPNDSVWVLGDLILCNNVTGIQYLKRLNGQLYIIFGNHDTEVRKNLFFKELPNAHGGWYAYQIKDGKWHFYLSHYPTLTSNYDEKHVSQHLMNLHGHTHQQTNWLDPTNPFMYHVGLDSHNCTPVSIEEIRADIKQKWEANSKD